MIRRKGRRRNSRNSSRVKRKWIRRKYFEIHCFAGCLVSRCLVIDLIRWYDHEEDKVELGAVVEAEGELKTELKTQLAAELISVKLEIEVEVVEVVEAVPGVNDFEVDESS